MIKNELNLLKEMLPIWQTYADGFVFLDDGSTDGSQDYLLSVKEKYNIKDVLIYSDTDDSLKIETDNRQLLFNAGREYSNKIICLDADEYLDGSMSKDELEEWLDKNPDTTLHLSWIQYTSALTKRVDGPWKLNWKDRIGSYTKEAKFNYAQMHSTHLPTTDHNVSLDPDILFIAHLQWLDKNHVGIKQYYWKVVDYINKKVHGADVVDSTAYDASVNDFKWEEEYIQNCPLRVRSDIFEDVLNTQNYRVAYIQNQTVKHNIPNLGDWGLNIHKSVPQYYCTAADDKHYPLLLNMIGSVHAFNFYDLEKIYVYDIGLTDLQIAELKNIKKVEICQVEEVNSKIFEKIETGKDRFVTGLFSWKPVIIKDALDKCPYVLYLDAGTTILKPLNDLFIHLSKTGYIFFDCGKSIRWMVTDSLIAKFKLNEPENSWILAESLLGIDAGFQGVSRMSHVYDNYVVPMYELSNDIKNFEDDGTSLEGWGTGRHDQTLFSIIAAQNHYEVYLHDRDNIECTLSVNSIKDTPFHLTHRVDRVTMNTSIFRSRWNLTYRHTKYVRGAIRRHLKCSAITAIGSLDKYNTFLPRYFRNIADQVGFNSIEFIIVYKEWSSIFDDYQKFPNIKFIKEDESHGVYHAWNIGVSFATTEFVTNWNVDDLRFNINCEIKRHKLEHDLAWDMLYNWYTAVPLEQVSTLDPNNMKYIAYPDAFHDQVMTCCMAGPDPMWRKCIHMFLGLFDYKNYSVIGDWEMWARMANYGLKFKLIQGVLAVYVDHTNNVSKTDNVVVEEQKLQLQRQYVGNKVVSL